MQRPQIPLSVFSTTRGISKIVNFLSGKRMTDSDRFSRTSAGLVSQSAGRSADGKSDTNSATDIGN